jgi:myo-inositol-1(or 4)-monophosphatase
VVELNVLSVRSGSASLWLKCASSLSDIVAIKTLQGVYLVYHNSLSTWPSIEHDQLLSWARRAGQIALDHLKDATPQVKPDRSFLTQVDLDIERFLTARIRAAYPDYGLISEEGTRAMGQCSNADIWVVDPLDGTTAFVQGLPGWGISIGLLHRGCPCFGLFHMPLLDDLSYTTGQTGTCCGDRGLHQAIRMDWGKKGFLAVSASAHHGFEIDVRRTRTLGSVGASLVYTARGAAAAALIPKAHVWDLVAGAAILAETGGELRYLSGDRIDYLELVDGRLAPEAIIAGHPNLLDELSSLIRPRSLSEFSRRQSYTGGSL